MTTVNQIAFEIEGMSCASCVGRVEKKLKSLNGVQDAVVNLATESATVSGHINAQEIAEALKTAHYPVRTETIHLTIDNMSCASCIARVEKALAAGPGVLETSVNLASETATVQVLSGAVTAQQLANIATARGYPAQPQSTTNQDQHGQRNIQHGNHLRRMTWIAAALTLPVFLVEMGGHLIPAIHHWVMQNIGMQTSWVVQFILTTIVMAWPGRDFYLKGFPALFKGTPDMNSLVALGSMAAWIYSVVATFAPALLPPDTRAVYFEAAAVIVTLILLGRYLEARAKGRTGNAVRKLIGLQPRTAQVERQGSITETPIEHILRGDIIHVKPGEKIATDGVVIGGHSYVDESMISGEPERVKKEADMKVVGGTINGTGSLRFRAENVGEKTVLAQIIRLVEQAQGAKLPIQDIVNKVTAWFVPAVLVLALITTVIWLIFGPTPALTPALIAGVSVLIIACPCAMGLATPTSIIVGTGRAAEMGVLFRKGSALQTLQDTRVVAVDKTGTLTKGQPELTHMQLTPDWQEDALLALVAAVETHSEHPIAQSLVRAAKEKQLPLPDIESFNSITGMGVKAQTTKHNVLIGADRLMQRESISLAELASVGQEWAQLGRTPLYVAVDGRVAAVLAVTDPIKPTTPKAIKALQSLGLKVAMITGDNQSTADAIARELSIDHVVAEVLPEGKIAALKALSKDGSKVAFVGDGINDAPALATADVGIAIGTGTDVAIESADVVLMSGDLTGVVNAYNVSQHTMQNIRQNLFWAFGYNVLLIPIAAGVLYPFYGLMLSPMLAAGAMALSSVFVLSNALRLRFIKPLNC